MTLALAFLWFTNDDFSTMFLVLSLEKKPLPNIAFAPEKCSATYLDFHLKIRWATDFDLALLRLGGWRIKNHCSLCFHFWDLSTLKTPSSWLVFSPTQPTDQEPCTSFSLHNFSPPTPHLSNLTCMHVCFNSSSLLNGLIKSYMVNINICSQGKARLVFLLWPLSFSSQSLLFPTHNFHHVTFSLLEVV